MLESLLRNRDGKRISDEHIQRLAGWQPQADREDEIPFVVARIVLQDFTGVPLLADLAAMRGVAGRFGQDPAQIEPLVPVDLVVDHSVQVDHFREPNALDLNMRLEFRRNAERYRFIKWGMQAFDTFRVVPPGIGIVHQVNLEYLARGVIRQGDLYYPDTLVGTDSHTTMINALGVVGWGVGGIEAEAGMLGQPVYILTPDVVGVHLAGRLQEGVTATDLVLAVTEMLRKAQVVGKFVEFFGDGAASLTLPDRATIANMAPEYGATVGFFPPDDETAAYLGATGRSADEVEAFRNYFVAQDLFGMPRRGEIDYSLELELDLADVVPSVAGPGRPQDRIALPDLPARFDELLLQAAGEGGYGKAADTLRSRVPVARRPPPRPRRCADCRHHLMHQHLQPRRDAGRRPARPQGGGPRPAGRAAHQDLPRPGLPRGHRLPGPGRSDRPPGGPGFSRGGLRLHHLHRQRRPPGPGPGARAHPPRPDLRLGAVGQPQFRGAHPPVHQGQLPDEPAAGGGLCPGRADRHRLHP
jgi:aconitate hydratase 1